jgi:catechol 2,3-dioxygenase-like lactoylglutathione lyase family enzyme
VSDVALRFEGIIGYSVGDTEEAAHFFERTLGLALAATDGGLRFYQLSDAVTLTVDVTGGSAGEPPYLMFSATDLVAAGEHFLERGCAVRGLPWAPAAAGFLARSPEGHTVCIVDEASLAEGEDT